MVGNRTAPSINAHGPHPIPHPDPVRVRDREKIPGVPDPSDVKYGEDRGANHRENGHRFSGAINRRPPFLTEQAQDRRDQRTGVTDTHPPYEVGDIPCPAYRFVYTPSTDTHKTGIGQSVNQDAKANYRKDKPNPPEIRRFVLNRPTDVTGNIRCLFTPCNQWFSYRRFVTHCLFFILIGELMQFQRLILLRF